jgi:peptidoglycan/LPS O-acetylase OafA/YrhL
MSQVMSRETRTKAKTRLTYQPALDGVRAIAVAMVLFFHAGFGWMRAGYLGVSIFFTLSGFLITSILLREGGRTGDVNLSRFYARRLRRLLPASLLCLTFIGVAYLNGQFASVPKFRGQMLGAALNVYNWVQIGSDSRYGDVYAGTTAFTSPLEHYWSLAIEEQFYLIWPVVLLLIIRRFANRDPKVITTLITGLFVFFAITSPLLAIRYGPDFAYWSTPTRFAEILAGAALAAAMISGTRIPVWIGRLALPALAGLVVLAVVLPSASGPAYTGWMGAIAIVSGLLILGLQAPSSLRSTLSVLPLVALGRMSYGIYLFHWPVFVLYRQHGWDLSSPGGFIIAVGTTVAISATSYFLIEQVIRNAKWPSPRTILVAGAAIGVSVAAILAMPVSRGFLEPNADALASASIDPDEKPVTLISPEEEPAAATTSTPQAAPISTDAAPPPETDTAATAPAAPTSTTAPTPAPEIPLSISLPQTPNRPVRVLTVGDSTAFYVGQALAEWAVDNSDFARSNLLWCQGCGFILDGTITSWDSAPYVQRSGEVVRDELPQWVNDLTPDVVVLMTTVNDMTNRIWADEEGILTPFDELYFERMTESYNSVTETLIELGVPNIVWISPPVPNGHWPVPEMAELERWDVLHGLLTTIEENNPDRVTVVDLADWMNRSGHTNDPIWRPDGTHLTEDSALILVNEFLGPLLVRTALGASVT